MNHIYSIVPIALIACGAGCADSLESVPIAEPVSTDIALPAETYQLLTAESPKALLVLFPGGGTTSKDIITEFPAVPAIRDAGISVLLMDFNRHLWITDADARHLSSEIARIVQENQLPEDKVYLGGMSIGGTVAVSLASYLVDSEAPIQPEGVFIIDSPIDVYALYESARKDLSRTDFTEQRLEEPNFIVSYLEDEFGGGDSLLTNILKVSPVVISEGDISNITALEVVKLRLYTEPDSLWWRESRQTDFENTNAYIIAQTYNHLDSLGWNKVDLIETNGKGYRANGERHPHSWSLVEPTDLIAWILE